MAFADWSELTNNLSDSSVARGATGGVAPPNGGATFAYVMNSLLNNVGVVGLYASPQSPNTNFNPMLSGGIITGAIQRAPSGGLTGYSAFLFIGLQGNDVGDEGYLLGLSDGNPSHLELRKGILSAGLPDEAPGGANRILRRSTSTFAVGEWVHLFLEMVVNDNGDVVLNCKMNDLVANPVDGPPTWVVVPGMAAFTDDLAGIASGTLPYLNGRAGFGARFDDSVRRAYFDHLTLARQ